MLVKSLRQKNNWSQEHLAQLSGLNVLTIQRVEKGEGVGLETLKSLASVFDTDVNEIKNENKNHKAEVNNESIIDLEKREEIAKAEVKAKKEFYMLALFLLGIFVFSSCQIIIKAKI